mgnify:CR=1 FL=1
MSKYYEPPHAASAAANPGAAALSGPPQLTAKNPFSTTKEQRAFERTLWEKTRKATGEWRYLADRVRKPTTNACAVLLTPSGDIILYDSHLVLFKTSLDVIFYVVGPADENPLMLSSLMSAIFDSISLLLRGQVEKRAILENLDLVTLAVDECVDDG